MEIKTIGGVEFAGMLTAAAAMIENNKSSLNELNVFPVPDGDTGTNMSMTIGAAADQLASGPISKSLSDVSSLIASSLLRGARGNSGVILSLLFRGMSKKFKGKAEADAPLLAEAMKNGVEAAYGAVMKPAEGTVLTVSRMAADAALNAADAGDDVFSLLEKASAAADEALALTATYCRASWLPSGGKPSPSGKRAKRRPPLKNSRPKTSGLPTAPNF